MSYKKLRGSNHKATPEQEYTVYVLYIQVDGFGQKYYIGRSKNFDRRLKQHKLDGAEVTHLTENDGKVASNYQVLEVINTFHPDTLEECQIKERQLMVDYAHEYGVTKVAGGK